ncbi:MAG TPA: FCD domain-containing protein [Solirubrobacterales bacterium]|nr:FCD domain-containing protein [Solirubrobacterales bacterium]
MSSPEQVVAPIEVPAAYGVVVEYIRRAIHLGVYSAGDRLPPERAHAKQLGVSRVTLREALRVLEGEGYLEMRRGATGGATVIARGETKARLRQKLDELMGIQDFRIANESLAARRAAERASEDDLIELERTIAVIRDEPTQHDFRRADSDFHLKIAAVADHELLRKAIEDARAAMFGQIDVVDFEVITQTAVRGHQRIVDALRDGDAAKAGQAMTAHVKSATKEILAVLDEDE